ncbi:MAG: hypothetical protein ACRERS_10390 [Methylococcales bacterium]
MIKSHCIYRKVNMLHTIARSWPAPLESKFLELDGARDRKLLQNVNTIV